MTTFLPFTAADVASAVEWAISEDAPVEILGHGSKRGIGRPSQCEHAIDLSAMSGVTLYEPEELVLSAKAGTPIADIERLLAQNNQQLAFEPMDCSRLAAHDTRGGKGGTIGGALSANLSGPRRLKAGAARDHILGVSVVSGRGETFKSGGRVVKNVTGYDLSKLMTGAWGTLGVLTDVTIKVLPAAETETTLAIRGLPDEDATAAMALAMGSSAEVSGAAHLPYGVAERVASDMRGSEAATLLRVEGFRPFRRLPRRDVEDAARERRADRGDDRPQLEGAVARHTRLRAFCRRHGTAGLARVHGAVGGAQNGACAAHGGRRRRLLRLAGRADMAAHGGRTRSRHAAQAGRSVRRRPCDAGQGKPGLARRRAGVRTAAGRARGPVGAREGRVRPQGNPQSGTNGRRRRLCYAGFRYGGDSTMTNTPPPATPRQTDRWLEPGPTNALVIYILYLAGLVIGISGLVGLVIAYINRGKAGGFVETHYTWQIRTFWIGLLYAVVSIVLMLFAIGFVLAFAVAVWFIVRCIIGIQALQRGEPIKNPQSWMI